jgi:26S proteasome regulatory subunit N9
VTISCLINQISDLPPEQRRIPLATIAERTKLSIDGVEFLLMKALALHLIEGSIDQVGAWLLCCTKCMPPEVQGCRRRMPSSS